MFTLVPRRLTLSSDRSRPSGRRAASPRVRPSLEMLETRNLLACGIAFAAGIVTIEGTNVADRAEVIPWGAGIRVNLDCGNNGVLDHVAIYGPGMVNQIKRIDFWGLDGDDAFYNSTAIASIAYGGKGNDDLHGGAGGDKLFGEEGNDCLCGGAGDDRMYGGDGNDLMHGWAGNDHLYGEAGNDRLVGDDGDDWLDGGVGADLLEGLAGDDHLDGGNDPDVDWLFGGAGADNLVWHAGDVRDFVGNGPFVPPC